MYRLILFPVFIIFGMISSFAQQQFEKDTISTSRCPQEQVPVDMLRHLIELFFQHSIVFNPSSYL